VSPLHRRAALTGCAAALITRRSIAQVLSGVVPAGVPTFIQSNTPATITGTITETNMAAVRIPGGSMGPNGIVRLTALFSFPNSANNKVLTIRWNPAAGNITTNAIGSLTATTTAAAQLQFLVRNAGATNSQMVFGGQNGITPYGNLAAANLTFSGDSTADLFLNINASSAGAGEVVTLQGYAAEIFRA